MMKLALKTVFRNFLFNLQRMSGMEKQSVLLGEIRAQQIMDTGKLSCLSDAEFSVFSQWGEDGIISWLVDRIQPEHKTFVEFGVEDYRESNTRYLLFSRNWSGVVIDGSDRNIATIKKDAISYKYQIDAVPAFITKDNISHIFEANGVQPEVGILSVDIDGVDYWVLKNIDTKAAIVIVEYNDLLDPHPVSVPYDPAFTRHEKHHSGAYYSASLTAYRYLLEARGYVFVGTNIIGTNAFFVHKDHINKVKPLLGEYKSWPSKIRDTRDPSGTLALKPYAAYKDSFSNLEFVNVTTEEVILGKDLFKET